VSVISCDNCGTYIDTDFNVESWDEQTDKWWCEGCFPDYDSDEPIAEQRHNNWSQGR